MYELIGGNPIDGWEFVFTAYATDDCSGIYFVEFYLNGLLQETVDGSEPIYDWSVVLNFFNKFRVFGLISNLNITEEYVNFFAVILKVSTISGLELIPSACAYDFAGNMACDEIRPSSPYIIEPGLYIFQNLILPNNYKGYIGNFIIFAAFS